MLSAENFSPVGPYAISYWRDQEKREQHCGYALASGSCFISRISRC